MSPPKKKIVDLAAARERKRLQEAVNGLGLYYILDGRKVKLVKFVEWAGWFEKDFVERRRVAYTKVGEQIAVSTVFLGIDHGFGFGPPMLFETLVFGGALDGEMTRYSTYAQAEAGHAEVLDRVRAVIKK